jgi:ubiquinone/menaquinone biosynthesis C-methylase UbiE
VKNELLWDEFAALGGVDHGNPAVVVEYDRKHGQLGDPVKAARDVLTRVGVQRDWRILDMGSGTGSFAVEAARSCSHVTAVDISQAMLDLSSAKARGAGLSNIALVKAGFLTYEHEGPLLDAVFTTAALHHLPDFWKSVALLRLSSMLKPGAKLYLADAIFSFEPRDYKEALEAELQAFSKLVDAEFLEQIRTDMTTEFMTYAWAIERMLSDAGFTIDQSDYLSKSFARYVCTKRPT